MEYSRERSWVKEAKCGSRCCYSYEIERAKHKRWTLFFLVYHRFLKQAKLGWNTTPMTVRILSKQKIVNFPTVVLNGLLRSLLYFFRTQIINNINNNHTYFVLYVSL